MSGPGRHTADNPAAAAVAVPDIGERLPGRPADRHQVRRQVRSRSIPLLALLLAATAAVGCQASGRGPAIEALYGRGPLTLSATAQRAWTRYLAHFNPQAFAVTADGVHYGWSHCPSQNCLAPETGIEEAMTYCRAESPGPPCHLYAIGREVVWRGE